MASCARTATRFIASMNSPFAIVSWFGWSVGSSWRYAGNSPSISRLWTTTSPMWKLACADAMSMLHLGLAGREPRDLDDRARRDEHAYVTDAREP